MSTDDAKKTIGTVTLRPLTQDEFHNHADHELINAARNRRLQIIENLLGHAQSALNRACNTKLRRTERFGMAIEFKCTMQMLSPTLELLMPDDPISWNSHVATIYRQVKQDGAFYLRDEWPEPGFKLYEYRTPVEAELWSNAE